jgi:hypothetical protein
MADLDGSSQGLAKTARQRIEELKQRYRDSGRFNQMRLWVVVAFVLDALLSGAVVLGTTRVTIRAEAWFQKGFPSNLIVVRQLDSRGFEDVEIVLDGGRYKGHVDRITPGANGFALDQQFFDAKESPPPNDYVPRRLTIRVQGGRQLDLEIGPPRDGPM